MRYKKILLLDHDEVDLYISTRIMKSASLADEIQSESCLEKALAYLENLADSPDQLPELIFLDLRMAETTGIDFLKEYMQLPEGIKLKSRIVVMTNSLGSDRKKIAEARNNPVVIHVLNKPLTVEALENI